MLAFLEQFFTDLRNASYPNAQETFWLGEDIVSCTRAGMTRGAIWA